jgi:hypothetical protein
MSTESCKVDVRRSKGGRTKTAGTHASGCFVAGTVVWTDKGQVRIEEIKVGDFVLSKHDSGTGEQAYKRVLDTIAHAP